MIHGLGAPPRAPTIARGPLPAVNARVEPHSKGNEMTFTSTVRLGATAFLMSSLSSIAVAQVIEIPTVEEAIELDPILIKGETDTAGASSYTLVPQGMSIPPAADGGALLRAVPGVTAGRMGGHGLEVIGLQDTGKRRQPFG